MCIGVLDLNELDSKLTNVSRTQGLRFLALGPRPSVAIARSKPRGLATRRLRARRAHSRSGRDAAAPAPLDRLVELTGWEPALVSEAVARAPDPLRPPAPHFVAQLAPAGLDPCAVAQAAASAEAIADLKELARRILTDVDAWSQAPADLVDLHERLDGAWRSWRDVREL